MIPRLIILLVALVVISLIFFKVIELVETPKDPLVQQAIIAGGFLAIGWLVGFILRDISTVIDRKQKCDDIQNALAAEISDYVDQLLEEDPEQHARNMWPKIKGKAPDEANYFHPFVPLVSDPVIFEALKHDIYYLPKSTIFKVTRFYSALSTVRLFAADQRTDSFLELPSDRRKSIYWDYMLVRSRASRMGWEALRELQPGLSDAPELSN